jgi:hypothetical protein
MYMSQPLQANVIIVSQVMYQLPPSTVLMSDAAQTELLRAFVNKSQFSKVKSKNQPNYSNSVALITEVQPAIEHNPEPSKPNAHPYHLLL